MNCFMHFCALISTPTSATIIATQEEPQVHPKVQSQLLLDVDR